MTQNLNFNSMECPWCGTDIDTHEPSACLDAWVAQLMGYKIITVPPGQLRTLYLGGDQFEVVQSEMTPPVNGQLFVEVDREIYGEGHEDLRQVFSTPCVTPVPAYSGQMNFQLTWQLIDETSMLDRKERDVFLQFLERDLRKRAGEDIGWPELIFYFRPHIFCRAFIKTKLLRLSKLEDHVLAADTRNSA